MRKALYFSMQNRNTNFVVMLIQECGIFVMSTCVQVYFNNIYKQPVVNNNNLSPLRKCLVDEDVRPYVVKY